MERINLMLWKALNYIIGTREEVYIRQRKRFIEDIILNFNQILPYQIVTSGSKAEGLVLPGSDQDYMHVITDITVNPKQINVPPNSDLIMDTHNMKPGFAKLLLGSDRRSKDKLGRFVTALTPADNNRVYLCSVLFRDKVVRFAQQFFNTEIDVEPHGPCATHKIDGNEYDQMVCFRCKVWPYEANEWIQRRRVNNWPAQDLVKEITEEGCLLVPVGNPLSQNSCIEWRISFSLAEKALVHSMNHTQILCYGLLKLFLKHVINTRDDCKGLLCSYFLKTALFYSIEEDILVWDQHNILNCFWACFKRLFLWIRQGYLPNYFIKTNNMIESKIFGDFQARLVEHLHNLYTCGSDILLRIPMIYTSMSIQIISESALQKINECRCDTELFSHGIPIYYCCSNTVSENIQKLLSLPQMSPVDVVNLRLILDSINFALTHYSYRRNTRSGNPNVYKYKQFKQLSIHILRNCTGFDICTGLLQYATLNFLTGRYSKVVCILEDVLSKFKSFILYSGFGCCKRENYINHICGKGFKIDYKKRIAFANSYECFGNCKFYPVEIELDIKEHEHKMLKTTFIPPKVYSYVLLCLTYHRTGNIASRNQTLDILCEATNDNHFITEYEQPVVSALLQRCVEMATAPIPLLNS